MPWITKNPRDSLLGFRLGSTAALRETSDLVDQPQAHLRKERDRHRFNLAEKEKEIVILLRELAQLRYELARRDTRDALANAASPSAAVH
jgi:hypothetical protein